MSMFLANSTKRALLAGLLLMSATTWARKPAAQRHEVAADLGLAVANEASDATLSLQYTFTPAALERFDAVHPALRRFVRHASELHVRVLHDGSSTDTRNLAVVGGTLHLFDGVVFVAAEAGVENDEVVYDAREDSYITAPYTVELGARPLPLLSLSAFLRDLPIVSAPTDDIVSQPVTRDGRQSQLGGVITVASPGDRFLGRLRVGLSQTRWSFSGFHPGDVDAEGLFAEAAFSFQTSRNFSWLLELDGKRESWNNQRLDEMDREFVGRDVKRQLYGARATIGFVYWFQGKLGFRVGFGGGFENTPPIYYHDVDRGPISGFGQLALGLVTRF